MPAKKTHVKAHDRSKPKPRQPPSVIINCAHCNGTGRYFMAPCEVCGGKGKVRV